MGKTGHSFIENFFDPSLLKTVVGGKTFNPQKDHDAPNEYGKVVFAEQVIAKNAAKIDFSGFMPLIERLAAVITEYKK